MSADAYGCAISAALRDISCQVGPPSASTRTSSKSSLSLGVNAPKPDSTTKSTFGVSWPGRKPVTSTGTPVARASAIAPGPALVTTTSLARSSSGMKSTKPRTSVGVAKRTRARRRRSFSLRPQTATTCHCCGSHASTLTCFSRLPTPEAPAQSTLLTGCRRPEAQVDRQAEQLDAVRRHAPAQRDLARELGRSHHEVRLAEGPAAVEIDEVGDDRHQRARAPALLNGLVRDLVQQRMHREDDVGVVLLDQLDDHVAHASSKHRADGGERRLRVARVIHGAPRYPRALDDRRVQSREASHHGRPLRDEWVGDRDLAGGVELFQGVGQCPRRRAVTSARIAEEDQDPRRGALRRRTRGRRAGACVRLLGAYLRRAAARRAIHRMLYGASRNVTKTIAAMPMDTHRMVRLASSPGDNGGDPAWFC